MIFCRSLFVGLLPYGITWMVTLLLSTGTADAQQPEFKAGAAKVNITPSLGSGLVGNFGTPPPAMHVHDELQARVLVLDDSQSKLVFVVADNLHIGRDVLDEAKRLVNLETKIPKENLMMSSTHTHSGANTPAIGAKQLEWTEGMPMDDYSLFIARRLADGVRIALNNLAPAQIGWGKGKVPQHLFNRRWFMKEKVKNPFGDMDQVQMNPGVNNQNKREPAGPTDPEVSFISVRSRAGQPIAILANYSLHYVGGVPRDHVSADYFAVFADRIQELLKADRQSPAFVGIMSNGTSGDVNNIDFSKAGPSFKPYEKMKLVADDVATEVLKVYQNIRYNDWVKLRSAQSELKLVVRKPTETQLKRARTVHAKPADEKPEHPLEKTYAERMFKIHEEWPDEISVIMQTFGIGDLGIAAIPFEVFTQTGLDIKSKSPFKSTFTVELANGAYGYLPTPEQHKFGGYETWLGTNRVEYNASVKITDALMKLFDKIK